MLVVSRAPETNGRGGGGQFLYFEEEKSRARCLWVLCILALVVSTESLARRVGGSSIITLESFVGGCKYGSGSSLLPPGFLSVYGGQVPILEII